MTYKYFIASIVMFAISMVVGHLIINNFLSILVQIIVSIISYFTALIILKDKMIFEGLEIFKRKLKIKGKVVEK